MSQPMYTTNAPHCPRHGFAPHPGGECVACEREDLERAVLTAAVAWRNAHGEHNQLAATIALTAAVDQLLRAGREKEGEGCS